MPEASGADPDPVAEVVQVERTAGNARGTYTESMRVGGVVERKQGRGSTAPSRLDRAVFVPPSSHASMSDSRNRKQFEANR